MATYDGEPIGWDDRKQLSWLWQDYSPLPPDGLCDETYAALIAVAQWGARWQRERDADWLDDRRYQDAKNAVLYGVKGTCQLDVDGVDMGEALEIAAEFFRWVEAQRKGAGND